MKYLSSFSDAHLRHVNSVPALICIGVMFFGSIFSVFAAKNLNLQLTVSPGVLSIDVVDASFVTVSNPSFSLDAISTSFTCQSTPGLLGTASQQIYIKNPGAANNGWTMALAAAAPTSSWTGTGGTMDFNDPTTIGCTDGTDTDAYKGQLTVNPSVGTLTVGNKCTNCNTTSITKGTSSSFDEEVAAGAGNSITLLTAASGSSDFGDWALQGVSVSQTIPAEQIAATDYTLPMVLSVLAS